MENQTSSKGLIAAILFASIIISGSLVFFGLQVAGGQQVSADTSITNIDEQIQEGIERYVQRQLEDQQAGQANSQQQKEQAAQNIDKPEPGVDHMRGSSTAKVTLIEYSDFDCPYCQRFHETAKQVIKEYGNDVNWVYRHFPLSSHNPSATNKAIASECAYAQGGDDAYWQYADALFENMAGTKTEDALVALAKTQGLDEESFKKCLDEDTFQAKVATQTASGTKAGVTGTPGNFLYDHDTGKVVVISGAQPFANVKAKLDELLK